MRYTLNITANNITYKEGDSLLVSFSEPFAYIKSIDSITFDLIPLDTLENGHDIQFRWSYDTTQLDRATGKPHVNWSDWVDYSRNSVVNSNFNSTVENILSKKPTIDIQFRLVRRGSEVSARRIETVVLDITHSNPPEVSTKASDFFPVADSCKANSIVTTNFNSGVSLNCTNDSLFRPYDVMGPGIQLWKDLSCAVSEMFGHCVRYFKTQAKLESADTILKEYSLYEVTDVKDIKILVPNNEFPDNAVQFMAYDMDFGDGIEVHIVKEHFERAFGYDDLPEQKDYLYFPLVDRIYEVHSAYLFKDFMAAEAYYKVMLYKWQDKANVMREDPEIAQYIDDLTDDFDEILQPEIDKEFLDITKPQQYTTTSIGGFDKVRDLINTDLKIEVRDMSNYFTVVSKYYYDMKTGMNWGDLAVRYKLKVDRKIEDNTAFTMWFKTNKQTFIKSPNTYDILLEGYNDTTQKGYRITVDYGEVIPSNAAYVRSMTIKINGETHIFDVPQLTNDKWYGLIVNHRNEHSQISLSLWEMKYDNSRPTQNKTTDLRLIYTKALETTPQEVITGDAFSLRAGTYASTNIRVMSETIEEEKQALFLNQYIVREARYGLLICNAIPPLRMIREYVR
jgi:hypothetical protein